MPLSLLTLPQKIIRTKIRKKFDLYNFSVGYTECEMLRNIAFLSFKAQQCRKQSGVNCVFFAHKKIRYPYKNKNCAKLVQDC